jgi:hypothetical protein
LLRADRRARDPEGNIFLFGGNAAGREIWLHASWSSRPDLEVLQKLVR